MKELIQKLKDADGPSRELDAAILGALNHIRFLGNDAVVGDEPVNVLAGKTYSHPAPITASIDAALALTGEVLPGWTRDVDATAPECGVDVRLHAPLPSDKRVTGTHSSEPIATIIALLTALKMENTNDN